MHILVIFSYNYSLKTWNETGNINRELKLYQSLNFEKNVNFTFFTYGNNTDKAILEEFGQFNLITFQDIFRNDKNILIKSLLVPFFLKKRLKEIDIIKCIQLNGSWVGIILKFLINKPLYIKTGFDQFIFSIYERKSLLKKCLFYLLTQVSLMSSNLYTVASKHDLSFIKKNYYFFNKKKLKLRPNWVQIVNNKNKLNKFENKVISIGRLSEQKNYPYIIDALKESKLTLDIIGSGELYEQLSKQAIQNKVQVNFLGNLSNNLVLEKLQQNKYFIIASKFEGNPKVVLEAMSAGCVVIASSIPNNTEIVEDGVNGFLFDLENKKNDILQIIEKSEKLGLYEIISKNAIEYIKTNNSLKTHISMEFEDYKSILKIH